MNSSTKVVAALAALSGLSASSLSAVSLTRIAGAQLGFPDYLWWTLTVTADIGAIAGAVMWTTRAPGSEERRTGVKINVTCSAVSATAVGLDHLNHADHTSTVWLVAAFLVGVFMPLMSTWLVHGVAKMAWAMAAPEPTEVLAVEPVTAPVAPIEPATMSIPTVAAQSTLKAQVRAEWFRQAREALAEGRSLDTIVSAQVDVAAGAKPGYCKKLVKGWRIELEAEVA